MKSDVRDLIYVYIDGNKVVSYGIEFNEFMAALDELPNNILILKGHYGTHFDFNVNREYCTKDDFDEFVTEDVYSYGDFSWIDFEDIETLKRLSNQEIAELYFFANKWTPLSDSFFKKLNNRFFYNAHDDGWVNWTYYNDIKEFHSILKCVTQNKVKHLYGTESILSKEDIAKILDLSTRGVAISLIDANSIGIYELGMFSDMDKMFDEVKNKKPSWIIDNVSRCKNV